MRTLVLCIIFMMSISSVYSQNGVPTFAGARGTAMGGASSTFQDINSIFSNQAGLAHLEGVSFTLGSEQRFIGSEIGSYSLGVAYPLENAGTFGLSVNYYGFADYNEQRIGLSYARKLAENFSIGAQFDYLGFSIPEYGNKGIFTFELGMQATLIENVTVAAHVFNPIRQEVVPDENIPTVVKLGVAYSPSDKLLITGELEKDIDFEMQVKAGVEYYIIDILALRAGFGTEPTQNSFGIGLKLKSGFKLDVASSYHYSLGFTPAFSLSYDIIKKDKK